MKQGTFLGALGLFLTVGTLGFVPAGRATGPMPEPRPVPTTGPVTTACFSPDGKWVLTGDYSGEVFLWRTDARKPVWSIETHKPRGMRLPQDGSTDPDKAKNSALPGDWGHAIKAVAFAADGKRVFVALTGGVAELDREKGTVLRTTKFPKSVRWLGGPAPMVVFLPGSDECVYYGDDDRLVRFDFKANKRHEKFDLRFSDFSYLHLDLSPDAKRVLVYDGQKRYAGEWDLATGESGRLFGDLKDDFKEAGYTPDGEGVWFGRETRETRVVLDRTSGKRVDWPKAEALAKYKGWLWYAPNGKRAFGLPYRGGEDDSVEILQVEDGKALYRFSSKELFHRHPLGDREGKFWEHRPGLVVFSPDSKTVLLTKGTGERDVHCTTFGLWDMETGKHIRMCNDEP